MSPIMTHDHSSPAVLILASRFDFTCDYVTAALARRGVAYLRLNSEDLADHDVVLDPVAGRMTVTVAGEHFLITHGRLKSVMYRRPVFLRDYGDDHSTAQERFARLQWASLIQNLALFDSARWYNIPSSTYRAEHKALQLQEAARSGMRVPLTLITNSPRGVCHRLPGSTYAVKGLDTVMVRENGEELFGFTTFANDEAFETGDWWTAPFILQEAVGPKEDVRVTIIDQHAFAAKVLVAGAGVEGDWRLHKQCTEFIPFTLPSPILHQCLRLMGALGLRYGAIDFALAKEEFFFLEVNPTGEWAWLVDSAGLAIDEVFADALAR